MYYPGIYIPNLISIGVIVSDPIQNKQTIKFFTFTHYNSKVEKNAYNIIYLVKLKPHFSNEIGTIRNIPI